MRRVRTYETFKDMIEDVGIKNLLPDHAGNIDAAVRVYKSFGTTALMAVERCPGCPVSRVAQVCPGCPVSLVAESCESCGVPDGVLCKMARTAVSKIGEGRNRRV